MPKETLKIINKRILLVGGWNYGVYQKALSEGFEICGCEVIAFAFKDYINTAKWWGYIQAKLLLGPDILRLNRELINKYLRYRPDIVFLHKNLYVSQKTINLMKMKGNVIILSYNHDNPFVYGKWTIWRRYLKSIKSCDINLFGRPSNVEYAGKIGIPNSTLLLSYYVENLHRPHKNVPVKFRHNVIFAGHYEPDGRSDIIEYLIANGIFVKIYGTGWEKLPASSVIRQQKIDKLNKEEYAYAISGAKIAIVFLSKHNKDIYTRRCFEIPASGTFMMLPDNCFLKKLFQEDVEAVFYNNKEELLEKIRYYVYHPLQREKIARAGKKRVIKDKHNNVSRAGEILSLIDKTEKCNL